MPTARLILIIVAALAGGCATPYQPQPLLSVPFQEHATTQHERDIRVTAAVLSAEETEAVFGLPLYERGIQPIWLEIENESDEPAWYLPVGTDPEYFAPLEVAYMHRGPFSAADRERIDALFHGFGMGRHVAPDSARRGFVFTHLDHGTKGFNVDVIGSDAQLRSFTFFIEVPGFRPDHMDVSFEDLYRPDEIVDHDAEGLRAAFADLPCCTTNRDGTGHGDPMNVVIVATDDDLLHALIRGGWDETASLSDWDARTARRMGGDRYAPARALFFLGRTQDAALRKAREDVAERNQLRLWLSPYTLDGVPVWIGQVAREIGERRGLSTLHYKIDPDVDEARTYLLQNLLYAQVLAKWAYLAGVGPAPVTEPRRNLDDDPYFTDGHRVVLWLSRDPISLAEVERVDWETLPTVP